MFIMATSSVKAFIVSGLLVSGKVEKVIISGNKGIKLANEREFEKFITAEYREIFKKLKQIRTIGKKVLRDQQMDFEGKIYEAFAN